MMLHQLAEQKTLPLVLLGVLLGDLSSHLCLMLGFCCQATALFAQKGTLLYWSSSSLTWAFSSATLS